MTLDTLLQNARSGQYSKILYWEVEHFMSFEKARAEFDGTNVVNIKGFNSVGKSAMLRALDVCFFNIRPSGQVGYIQDGHNYFRITVYFSDGVRIVRDKYKNGQSLYEMIYNDNGTDTVLFTTRLHGALTKVVDVPEVIVAYLGMTVCKDWNVNSRSCFEPRLLVETKGKENYFALHEVLQSETAARAITLLNNDKNSMKSEIMTEETELQTYHEQLRETFGLSQELMDILHEADRKLDIAEEKAAVLDSIQATLDEIREIPNIPPVEPVTTAELTELSHIADTIEEIRAIPQLPEVTPVSTDSLDMLAEVADSITEMKGIPDIPAVPVLDTESLTMLGGIMEAKALMDAIPDVPEVPLVNAEQLALLLETQSVIAEMETYPDIPECTLITLDEMELLKQIMEAKASLDASDSERDALDARAQAIAADLTDLQAELAELGEHYVVCQNCGAMVSVDSGHVHD